MDFHITSEPQDVTYAGQIITYTLRPLLAITMAWTTEITHVTRPNFFVDEQRFGPYRFWHHQHFFRQVDAGVEMRDLIHYLLPHMQFTALVNRLIVKPRLKRIFDYRAQALQKIFVRNQ
jgi:ligand-binding SRPBCC domain-containing protein